MPPWRIGATPGTSWNCGQHWPARVHAARELGISRSTLQRRLKAYRIQP
ncbi:hypothetical protein JWS13_29725 [Rhodococcus pseudokoreensis]|uniref:DNA binding HTH domain-containing protein n=1 Tax=Rhodococcus pseudokoreensis TaxID=2811421 RepID=A0A974W874_9NOCA|nr:hypothetical protein JWS13_29725 [Rhodococcus pseudokoreensis]